MERWRLERLFGSVWQAALAQAEVLSRRRLREIGASGEAAESLEAVIELLECTSPDRWPDRWRGLGKASSRCPTLAMPAAAARLVDGRIAREDAVLVWDDREPGPGTTRFDADRGHPVLNLSVGLFYKGIFDGLPRDDAHRTRWQLWHRQWQNLHGLPLVSGSLYNEGATPEGCVAIWIHRRRLTGEGLEAVLSTLEERVHGFSRGRVDRILDDYRRLDDDDEDADADAD